tara:strand:+ start:178 stop:471 length:294 start_codon:yes stop_codon:yes gene_type:complete
MTKYKGKSMFVSRAKNYNKKDDLDMYPYFIHVKFFKINDAHKTTETPFQILEFRVLSVYFKGFKDSKFLPWGNDLLFNDITEVEIEQKNKRLYITNV